MKVMLNNIDWQAVLAGSAPKLAQASACAFYPIVNFFLLIQSDA